MRARALAREALTSCVHRMAPPCMARAHPTAGACRYFRHHLAHIAARSPAMLLHTGDACVARRPRAQRAGWGYVCVVVVVVVVVVWVCGE